jgi:type I restriction enzyme S subunit
VAFCRIKATEETVSESGYQNSSIKLHPKGTVLIAMIGEGKTRGQVAILDIPACHSQNSAAIRVSETPIPPEYIYHFLASRYDQNRKRGQGGNQPALNKELVQSIPVPLPPLPELSELIDDVERRLAIADVMEAELNKAAAGTRSLRQSILKSAFSGKLVPQDPNDESAEELLKRIAAERAAQGGRTVRSAAPRAPRKARAAAQKSASAFAAPAVAVSGLAAARKAAGLSQAQLAERAGINQAYVSQMETGKRAITTDQAAALALALGIEPSALTQA